MRLRHHRGYAASDHTGIDLAPMLDFVMNLLIFFIITAVFVKEFGVHVSRPSAGVGPATKEAGSLLIQIRAEGEILVDDRLVDIRAVRANVERLHAIKPDWGVMVVADENSDAGLLVAVVDQVKQGGVDNITFGSSRSK
jgi:biopolymer transport protein ExbD